MKCAQCGAALSVEAVQAGVCEYCSQPLPHALDAAAKAAAMQEILADRDGDGIPDALQQLDAARARAADVAAKQGQLEELRKKRNLWAKSRVRVLPVLIISFILAAVLSVLWAAFTDAVGTDAWLGQFAATICPQVCSDCQGPLRYYHPTGKVYCSPKGENIREIHWTEISRRKKELEAKALPGGVPTTIGAAAFVLFPLVTVVLLLMARRAARLKRQSVPRLDAQIATCSAELERLQQSS